MSMGRSNRSFSVVVVVEAACMHTLDRPMTHIRHLRLTGE